MKLLTLNVLTVLALGLTLLSCSNDEENEPFTDFEFLNCDDGGCNDKGCASAVSLESRIICAIEGTEDVDWYAVEVSQGEVDTNGGIRSFNFINLSDNLTFQVDLFSEGATAGDVNVTGNALIYEPGDDSLGGIQFFEPGTYYFKVERANGESGDGAYEIRMYL